MHMHRISGVLMKCDIKQMPFKSVFPFPFCSSTNLHKYILFQKVVIVDAAILKMSLYMPLVPLLNVINYESDQLSTLSTQ